ncbi:SDR family NAD(P)-dependent oxidoreductase [Microbulbifer taiwanensis]|uniref:SDR family NAD(P)-dependent oxidoreductase n=1 Tax=Microbulbifer taiwanensis TaxID=986746 RepID=A0ABW1YNK0_9GAMM|nr:SDR family oxidoreductase [Microbulbifer taiwanensis]
MKKTLVITGGSKGIGRAAAQLFLENGYSVVNLSRSGSELGGVTDIPVDLAREDWTQEWGREVADAVKGSDRITVIHNAAMHQKDSIVGIEADNFRRALQVNLVAPSQLNQLLLPLMKPGSSILYLGSTLSEKAVPGSCSYVVSKHGVVGMMRSSCQDLSGTGIHTACICPGFTDTEMLRQHLGDSEQVLRDIARSVTFNRLIRPQEIAETLYFCAERPVLNGALIHANLGQIES